MRQREIDQLCKRLGIHPRMTLRVEIHFEDLLDALWRSGHTIKDIQSMCTGKSSDDLQAAIRWWVSSFILKGGRK